MKKCGKSDKSKTIKEMNKYLIYFTIFICFIESIYGQYPIVIHETADPTFSLEEYEIFKTRILKNGDKEAYNNYILKHYGFEMLPYAIIMAQKYHLPSAYNDVYNALMDIYETNKIVIDSITWNMAFYYLNKGAKLNNPNCLSKLEEIYKEGNKFIVRDSIKSSYYKKQWEDSMNQLLDSTDILITE